MTQELDFAKVLGFLGRYQGKRLVFKIGGETVDNPQRLSLIARQITLMAHFGIQCTLVHGGGKQLTAAQNKAGIEKQMDDDGDRITDALTLSITKQVMRQLNEQILHAFDQAEQQLKAEYDSFTDTPRLGMRDLRAPILAKPKGGEDNFTGIPTGTKLDTIETILSTRHIPVLSCLSQQDDFSGQVYNVNGDRAAVAMADGLKAERLVFVTDVPGVMTPDRKQIFSQVTINQARGLISEGVATDGMAMKLEMAIHAIEEGNINAVIFQEAGSTLQELLTRTGKGTLIVPNNGTTSPIMSPAPDLR